MAATSLVLDARQTTSASFRRRSNLSAPLHRDQQPELLADHVTV